MHYGGVNGYLFVNDTEIIKFKVKDSEIVEIPLCLGNLPKDFPVNNMKKAWLNGCAYDFSVDYDAIAVEDILDIHKYLMKKNGIKYWMECKMEYEIRNEYKIKMEYKMFGFVKQIFISPMMVFSCKVLKVNPLKFVSMNNQGCKITPQSNTFWR